MSKEKDKDLVGAGVAEIVGTVLAAMYPSMKHRLARENDYTGRLLYEEDRTMGKQTKRRIKKRKEGINWAIGL